MATTRDAASLVAPWVLVVALLGNTPQAPAQESGRQSAGVLLEFPNFGPIPGSQEPSMGPGPGALEPSMLAPETGIIGGRRRAGRVPRSNKGRQVSAADAMAQAPAMRLPAALPEHVTSLPAAPALSSVVEDEGPPDGLTLDSAIQQMLAANLDVLALKYEIPQADADILTAGLRSNPLIYGDTQFIPYGAFTSQRPGGPTQYDLNITYPLDVSHKRQARVRVPRGPDGARGPVPGRDPPPDRQRVPCVPRPPVRTDQPSDRPGFRPRAGARGRRGPGRAGPDEKGGDEAAERLSIVLDKARQPDRGS